MQPCCMCPAPLMASFCGAELDPSAPAAASPYNATRFGDPAEVLHALAAAGFVEVQCPELSVDFCLPASGWWDAMCEMPLPFKVGRCLGRARGAAVGAWQRGCCLLWR